jgi:hypothetical protein
MRARINNPAVIHPAAIPRRVHHQRPVRLRASDRASATSGRLSCRGEVVAGEDRQLLRMLGIAQDITIAGA